MPMSFPNMESLIRRARQRGFREPHEGETEAQFRAAFSSYMQMVDRVEAAEIRFACGWDELSPEELLADILGGGDTDKMKAEFGASLSEKPMNPILDAAAAEMLKNGKD